MRSPRVAFFPDSFHEVNGVAHTSRNFVAYAQRHGLPMLCVRAGTRGLAVEDEGSVRSLELPRSAASVGMEKDLAFDPFFWRHADRIEEELHRFQPDLLHLTGPSELGIFAAYFAWKLKIPLAASWHTNVHEYAARRLQWLTGQVPAAFAAKLSGGIEGGALETSLRFYSLAGVLFAPNRDLCALLERGTGRACSLMQRGVDTEMFSPLKRTRGDGAQIQLGYVGRLSVEKNVALLPVIQRELQAQGLEVRFVIVGHGAEEEALRRALPGAIFTGVLRGEELARTYAEMDLFVFPSHTDTFGNVVLEALASGVPAVVTPDGGPRFIVGDAVEEMGVLATDGDFAESIALILRDTERLKRMRVAARDYALTCSWDAVFERVYGAYEDLRWDRERLCAEDDASSPG